MKRFQTSAALLCTVLFFGLSAVALAVSDRDKKDRPKDAPTLDDATGTLTEMVGGKEKKTKLDLNYCLKVKGYFDKDGFHIEEVDSEGPAAKLNDVGGAAPNASLENGDVITEVDGHRIKSAQDYAKALNGAADHAKTKIKVRDVNNGNEVHWLADAAKR